MVWKFEATEIHDAADRNGRDRGPGSNFAFLHMGNPDDYQNKGVANWAKRMVVKTKEIGKLAQIGKKAEVCRVGGGAGLRR